MVAKAEKRSSSDIQTHVILKEKIKEISKAQQESITAKLISQEQKTSGANPSESIAEAVSKAHNVGKLFTDATKRHRHEYSEEAIPFTITLMDAVKALQDIKCNIGHMRKALPMNDEQSPIQDETKRVGSLTGKETYSPRTKFKKRSEYIKPGTGIKKTPRSSACGTFGHWTGEKECLESQEGNYE